MAKFLQLHVHLRHTDVWRRLELIQSSTFERLHTEIQRAFGWRDEHLYRFEQQGTALAHHPHMRGKAPSPRVKLYRHLGRQDASCQYVYDFGDWWVHDVRVEACIEHELDRNSPVVLGGAHAAPPEDCGGLPGYRRLLEVARTGRDPWHEDATRLREWLGDWSSDL